MKNSLYILQNISEQASKHQTYYTFTKMEDNLTDKYKKGRVGAAKWINDLVYYYIQKENSFVQEFKTQLQNQKKCLDVLEDSDYKQGLFDELNIIEDMINDRINNSK